MTSRISYAPFRSIYFVVKLFPLWKILSRYFFLKPEDASKDLFHRLKARLDNIALSNIRYKMYYFYGI